MSDPLSITTGIVALIQVTGEAISFLKDVKEGGKERMKLRDELRGVMCLLEMLKDRVDEPESDDALKPAAIAFMGGPEGPLERMKGLMEDVVSKLVPETGLRKLAMPLKWPFDKKDILELFGMIERIKSHFTLVLQNDLLTLSKLMNEKVDNVSKQLDDINLGRRNEELEKILSWISPISFRDKQADVLQSVQPGTGKWFMENSKFRDWLSGEVSLLWCPGIPGAGKTNLASLTIDSIETGNISWNNNILAFVYCDYKRREAQTPMALISSILEQALQRTCLSGVPEEIKSLYTLHTRKGTNPTLKQLLDVFNKLFSQCSNIFIVIDALDECSPTDDLAIELVNAVQALGNNVRVLITSRTSTNFESAFREAARIDIEAQDQDVRLYLETKIPERSRLAKHIRADPKLQDDIIESIAESAQGMFLLVALNLHSLSRKLTRRDIRASLSVLPKTLDATYEQALERIRTQAEEDVELAETVIMWILCARRPLSVLALQHAYAVHLLSQDGDGESMPLEDDGLPPKDIITGVCGGLITVDCTSQIVRLVHYTAQDYLLRTHGKDLHQPRLELTKVSLDYLQLLNFSDGPALSDNGMAKRLEDFNFLEYAAKHWGSELHQLKMDTFWEFVDRFLSNEVAVNVASQAWGLPQHRYTNWSHDFATDVPAVVLAASFNVPEVLERLKSQGHDIEASGSDGKTPLIRSSRLGHAENISTLLRLGANIAAVDAAGETSVERATAAGKTLAVKALIDEGANVNRVTGTAGWSLLMSAILSRNVETVKLLVDEGADLKTETSWGETALSLAAVSGQEAIAGLLIDAGVMLPRNLAGRRATLQASNRGLSTLASRLASFNVDYGAVADVGVQRERVVDGSQLAQIAELDEPKNDETASQSQQPPPQEDAPGVGIAVALEGVPYQRGFYRRYDHLEKIGRGYFADVFSCRSKVTGVRYAVKIFTSNGLDKDYKKGFLGNEIRALTKLRHTNLMGLIDVAVTDEMDAVCLVLELATGGDLFNFITSKKKLTEQESRTIFFQMVSALNYMHKEGWAHRDVKPETILLYGSNFIKLGDFGIAINLRSQPDEVDNTLCGTPSYVAPEILVNETARRYSYSVDVWSAGVVLYVCLCGFPPFSNELYSSEFPFTLSQQIKAGRFDYPSPYWDPVGDPALDLIDSMLVVDPERRCSAEDCMNHLWVIEPEAKGVVPSTAIEPVGIGFMKRARSTQREHGPAKLKAMGERWREYFSHS